MGGVFVPPSKVRYRRFPVKAMCMGVVERSRESKNFDNRIRLEQASKTVKVRKLTGHQNNCDGVAIHQQTKEGGWESLHIEGITLDEM